MTKKKILIIIADIGNGHKSAANAITSVMEEKYSNEFKVRTIDLFEEAEVEPFNSGDISYKFLSQNRAYENISNLLWRLTNSDLLSPLFTKYLNDKLLSETEKIIKKEKPDLVISAYPLTCPMFGELRNRGYNFKYAVVITDLITIHRTWGDKNADLITAPTSEAVTKLIGFGVSSNKILYPLFPLRPELKNFRSKEEVIDELGLSSDKPIILLTGGGLGTKAIDRAINRLSLRDDLQLVVVAGKLDNFRRELEDKYKGNSRIKILGFVKNMQDYINAAEIIVGKPGATTVMEIELFEKKAVLTRYIGEHDFGNIGYALRDPKIRYIGDNWDNLDEAIDSLLKSEHRSSISTKRSFDETEKIVEEIVKLVHS